MGLARRQGHQDRHQELRGAELAQARRPTSSAAAGRGSKRAHHAPAASIVDEVKKSNLRGRGGAGFSTGMKWSLRPQGRQAGLPGRATPTSPSPAPARTASCSPTIRTCCIEGMAIASYALGCKHAYIYIRGEMMREAQIVQAAIDEAYEARLAGQGPPRRQRRRSSWTSPCTAAPAPTSAARRRRCSTRSRASAAGRGSSRRSRRCKGLFRQPTIVNNVETLMNVPDIIAKGGEWFAELGHGQVGRHAHRLRVGPRQASPGVYELPMGIPFRDLIYDVCGGMSGSGRSSRA